MADEHGRRRLDDPEDIVRLEIEAALTRKVRVIPVLVNGAAMPRSTDLPPGLQDLAGRQASVANEMTATDPGRPPSSSPKPNALLTSSPMSPRRLGR